MVSGRKDKCLSQCFVAQCGCSGPDAMAHSHAGVPGCYLSSEGLRGAGRELGWLEGA